MGLEEDLPTHCLASVLGSRVGWQANPGLLFPGEGRTGGRGAPLSSPALQECLVEGVCGGLNFQLEGKAGAATRSPRGEGPNPKSDIGNM